MTRGKVETVELTTVPSEQRSALANLVQLYLHDFSEFAAIGTDHGEVGGDGTFAYDWLHLYWQDSWRIPLFIQADGRLAGFALVSRWSALDRPVDHSMAEFFVVRKYRRSQVGLRAATLIFERFPGRWEVPVAWYNAPALTFWRNTILAATSANAEEVQGDGQRWTGPVLCFASPKPCGCV